MNRIKRINEFRGTYAALLSVFLVHEIGEKSWGLAFKLGLGLLLLILFLLLMFSGPVYRFISDYVDLQMDQPRRYKKIMWFLFGILGLILLMSPVLIALDRFRYFERWGLPTFPWLSRDLMFSFLLLVILHWIVIGLELITFYRLHRNDDLWIRLK